MNEILEGPENDFVADPLDDDLWNTWTGQATVNTDVYRVLFRADPDDNIKTFDDYDNFLPRRQKDGHLFDMFQPVKDVREKLDKIKGHLVWMPLDFLKDAEMAEPGLAVNQFTEVSLRRYPGTDTQDCSLTISEYLYLITYYLGGYLSQFWNVNRIGTESQLQYFLY